MLTHGPTRGDYIWGFHEVGQQTEGKFREVDGRGMLGGLRVPPVEFSYESLPTFEIPSVSTQVWVLLGFGTQLEFLRIHQGLDCGFSLCAVPTY